MGPLLRTCLLAALLAPPGCVDRGLLEDKDCAEDGRCLEGWTCDQTLWRCVRPAPICPGSAPPCGPLALCRERPPAGARPECCPAGACRPLDGRLWTEALPAPAGMHVDGSRADWASTRRIPLTKLGWGAPPASALDFACAFAVAWDAEGLYLLLECSDDRHPAPDSGTSYHEDDCAELFLDLAPAEAAPPYDPGENQLLVPRGGALHEYEGHPWGWTGQAAQAVDPGRAWWIELRVDWPAGLPAPAAGSLLGFDVAADDDDGEGQDTVRERQLFWNDGSGQAYLDARLFGLLVLRAEGQVASAPVCGDGSCDAAGETRVSCQADCD